jgi:hypothetical protein
MHNSRYQLPVETIKQVDMQGASLFLQLKGETLLPITTLLEGQTLVSETDRRERVQH